MKIINRFIAAVGCSILRMWLRLDKSLSDARRSEIVEVLTEYDRKMGRTQ
jgi:hypothetical protein